ncbi:MAG: hypothetical protein EOO73_18995 [Myxococcales bacterium]|nr:MAG: hypothetical protein EOO73_18995 [Myxococcales bacterium]
MGGAPCATSDKRQATSDKRQATSDKRQATSDKRQATSDKQQATSNRRQGIGDRRSWRREGAHGSATAMTTHVGVTSGATQPSTDAGVGGGGP